MGCFQSTESHLEDTPHLLEGFRPRCCTSALTPIERLTLSQCAGRVGLGYQALSLVLRHSDGLVYTPDGFPIQCEILHPGQSLAAPFIYSVLKQMCHSFSHARLPNGRELVNSTLFPDPHASSDLS